MNLYSIVLDLCMNRQHLRWICPVLLLAESVLCALIIWKIPYTEIDWTTYMQQVSVFLSGERDYTRIEGSTGPLVYPAAHVYIYSALYHVTDEGRDIAFAQVIFAAMYLTTLAIVMRCYRSMNAPPYLFGLLVLSKRLHSVFLLRLFNDAVATLFLWAAIYAFQRKQWLMGVFVWTVGVGVKMTLLLIAPAIAVALILTLGLPTALGLGVTAVLLQTLLAVPFLQQNATGYVSNAFQFTRQFLFKWTVNWRFVGEELFRSRSFSLALFASHLILLGVFAALRWIRPSGKSLMQLIRENSRGERVQYNFTGSTIVTIILESLVIGLLYARSLHYQFFAYIAWTSPLLLWSSGKHPLFIVAICLAQEWAWNVYPSTDASSVVVVMCLWLQVVESFRSTSFEISGPRKDKDHVQ